MRGKIRNKQLHMYILIHNRMKCVRNMKIKQERHSTLLLLSAQSHKLIKHDCKVNYVIDERNIKAEKRR